MSTNINNYDGTLLTSVADGSISTTAASIQFPGRGYVPYGAAINQNMLWVMQNFAASTAPSNPIKGQTWYDTVNKILKVYDNVSATWMSVGGVIASASNPGSGANLGAFWYNTTDNKIYMWTGSSWTLLGPVETTSGYSGYSGMVGPQGISGFSGYSGFSSFSGYSGYSSFSGYSGYSSFSGYSGESGFSGYSGESGFSGYSGTSGFSGYSGTQASIPTGTILDFAGSSAPAGFLLCGGQAVSRTTYSSLFDVIGTTYGIGDNSTTFNLPDLRGRASAGLDDMGGSAANRITVAGAGISGILLGASGGSQTHTLTISEMPAHTHTVSAFVSGGEALISSGSSAQGTSNTSSAGGGLAHQNTQPTLMLNKIIKT